MMNIPIYSKTGGVALVNMTVGKYRWVWKAKDKATFDAYTPITSTDKTINGKRVRIISVKKNPSDLSLDMTMELLDNPIPVAAILIGLLVVLGIGLTGWTLTKVEKVIDNPAIEFGVIVVSAAILVGLVVGLSKVAKGGVS